MNASFDGGPFGDGSHSIVFTSDFTGTDTLWVESYDYNNDAGWSIDNVSLRPSSSTVAPQLVLKNAASATTTILGDYQNRIAIGLGALQGVTASDVTGIGAYAGSGATSARYSNFIGQNAGYGASRAEWSNFIGQNAGYGASRAEGSNFIGQNAGYQAADASYSNFLGRQAGYEADHAISSNFFGNSAGQNATNAEGSNFFGDSAGFSAVNASYSNFFGDSAGGSASNASASNFLGRQAGFSASDASFSNFLGQYAGYGATNAANANFLGYEAGRGATAASYSNFFGYTAGRGAINANNSNFFGDSAGLNAVNASSSNFFGEQAGFSADNAFFSNFIGTFAGADAENARYSNFLGYQAGIAATNANNSSFLGDNAGHLAVNAAHSIFIGSNAGYDDTVNNTGNTASTSIAIGQYAGTGGFSDSIAIGHGVINSAAAQLNIGNVLYATGIYASDSQSASPLAGGKVGIGTSTPSSKLTVAGDFGVTGQSNFYDYLNLGSTTEQVQFSEGYIGLISQTAGGLIELSTPENGLQLLEDRSLFGQRVQVPAGSSSTPSYSFSSDSSAGLFNISSAIGFSTLGNERMRITSAGDVGIGTATPAAKLAIVGSGNVAQLIDATNSGASSSVWLSFHGSNGVQTGYVGDSSTGNGNIGLFSDTGVISISGTGGTCTMTGAASGGTCFSDERLKDVGDEVKNTLDGISRLNLKTFYWNDLAHSVNNASTTILNTGFLAQNVEAAFPELVHTDTSGYKTLDYGTLSMYGIKAIGELNLKLEDIATTTPFAELDDDSFAKKFFKALIAWFADQANGIGRLVADSFFGRELCLTDEQGTSCYTRGELDAAVGHIDQGSGDDDQDDASDGGDDQSGDSTTVDLCPNLDGVQEEVPTGYHLDADTGSCLEDEPVVTDGEDLEPPAEDPPVPAPPAVPPEPEPEIPAVTPPEPPAEPAG